jgi:hypothetical protein
VKSYSPSNYILLYLLSIVKNFVEIIIPGKGGPGEDPKFCPKNLGSSLEYALKKIVKSVDKGNHSCQFQP